MTPLIREAIMSTSFWLEGCLDLMRVAVLSTTVSMALRPAAFMVSPDSGWMSMISSRVMAEVDSTDEIHDSVGDAQRTGGFHASSHILYLRL